ncbi:uncharacterized protein LOC116418277 [Nasonia vitripennis]|uniref:JmjC domain-containing protein n=1 Tax=Nasonia vitripennis TaxID=7425 RepID=A0A7M7TBE4_NASVI|nr:uncharacterized protein LOC116418277 [Nasonia vitripennis]
MAEEIFINIFKDSKLKKNYMLYGRDLTIIPNKKLFLRLQKSTIRPNNVVPKIEGVNTIMCYVGGPGSMTAKHCEGGDFASLNLLVTGHPKIWGFIDKDQFYRLSKKLVQIVFDFS